MLRLEELFTNPLVKFLIVLLSVKNFINNNILVKFRSLLYKLNGHEAWTPWLYHHTNLMDVSVQVISFTLICSMFMCVYKYVAMWVRCHGTAVWQLALNVCVCVCVWQMDWSDWYIRGYMIWTLWKTPSAVSTMKAKMLLRLPMMFKGPSELNDGVSFSL